MEIKKEKMDGLITLCGPLFARKFGTWNKNSDTCHSIKTENKSKAREKSSK